MGSLSPYVVGNAGSLLTCLTVMTLMRPLTLNSYHSQTCDLGMVRVAEVMAASDLFYIDCSPGLLEVGRMGVDDLNWHLWGCPFGENLPDDQI